jgi:ParB-like chromosome segregation protein Spo0J
MTTTAKTQFRKLADLQPDPNNARTHDDQQVANIAASIERFGWTSPILVDDVVRAGNGRLAAAKLIYGGGGTIYLAPGKERGGKALPTETVPVIDCSGWTEEERTAYALADNRLAEQAGWDEGKLREQLDALATADFNLEHLGFDQAAMDALNGLTEGDAGGGRQLGELTDTEFKHADQYGVIVMCKDEADQQAIFERLRDEGLEVKVVVV